MERLKKLKGFENEIDFLNFQVSQKYYELLNDYKRLFNEKLIIKSFLKQRLFARLLTFRAIQPSIIGLIKNKIENKLKKKFFLAPLFYIRYCHPGEFFNKTHKNALLYTEPHYDKYEFNNIGNSFWLPILPTSVKTGTLCYIKKNKKILDHFPVNQKNKYNIQNYITEHQKIDYLLKSRIENVYCSKGDILYFDQNVLHAASGPISKMRLSLNFQVTYSKKYITSEKFNYTNNYLIHKNIINSLYFGDRLFYEKNKHFFNSIFKYKDVPKKLKYNFNKAIKKNIIITKEKLLKDVHYSNEDFWLKN